VFQHLVTKMSDWFLEQQINIKFCVKIGKNASDTCAMLWKSYGVEAMRKSRVVSGINSSKRACMLKSQMKTVLITFFGIKSTLHSEFIPQGQTVNHAYYVEILKQLHEAVHRKQPELWPNDKSSPCPANNVLTVKQFLDQKSINEMKYLPCDFLLFPKIKCVLKVWRFQDTEEIKKKMWWWQWKLSHNKSFKNVSNSGSIVGIST